MSIAEYQLFLKDLIDNTTDEAILKKWKSQLEADIESTSEKNADDKQNTSLNEAGEEKKSNEKDDTSDYVIIESGLGIDE
ncbi:MAG: hypothetical protein M3Y85_06090 [Bacteroidota bacterium]|nr:hypothetical protein [Bacteroidota bacterium]